MTRAPAPVIRPTIEEIPAYPGAALADPTPGTVRLNSNENLFGPSPKVYDAIRAELETGELGFYPAVEARSLNETLETHFDLAKGSTLSVGGGELLLPLIAQTYAREGNATVYFDDGFPKYRNYSLAAGARPKTVSREGDAAAQMLNAVTPDVSVVFLDNPGNPSGRLLPMETIAEIHAGLAPDVLLVLDEAYVEFSDFGNTGLVLAQSTRNTLVVRTFSKAYGLAGLRVGWATGHPDLLAPIRRIAPSFPIPRPSLVAALAALKDQDHLAQTIAEMRRLRDDTAARLRKAGWDVGPCEGNFIAIRPGTRGQAALEQAFEALAQGGVMVRPVPNLRGAPALRITIGRAQDMAHVHSLLGV